MTGIAALAKAQGAKGVKMPPFQQSVPDEDIDPRKFDPDYVPTIQEALARWGNKGTVIKR